MDKEQRQSVRVCKDCYPDGHGVASSMVSKSKPRPAPYDGPRCHTHHNAEKKRRKAAAHDTRVQRVYGLGPGDYERLYAIQGGRCAICRRAKGISKKLAVDHDHKTGLVRGLCCTNCNRLLGHARDELDFFKRAYNYLVNPPARQLPPKGES